MNALLLFITGNILTKASMKYFLCCKDCVQMFKPEECEVI